MDVDTAFTAQLHDTLTGSAARSRWRPYATVVSPDLNQRAVARAVADHLVDTGEAPGAETPRLVRRWHHRVNRLVAGHSFSLTTLRTVLDALDVEDAERERLVALAEGGEAPPAPDGRHAEVDAGAGTEGEHEDGATDVVERGGHRTVHLHERHVLDHRGLPVAHHTAQMLEATRDGVRRHRYRFSVEALVQVHHGGTVVERGVDEDGLHFADIDLGVELAAGQHWQLRYTTRFAFGDDVELPPQHLRASTRPVRNVAISVRFDPRALPARVWRVEGPFPPLDRPLERTPQRANPQHEVTATWPTIARRQVGFTWDW